MVKNDLMFFLKDTIVCQVASIKPLGKNSYIDRGIDKVTDTLFLGSGADRKIFFVLSDGKQTEDNDDVDLEAHVR